MMSFSQLPTVKKTSSWQTNIRPFLFCHSFSTWFQMQIQTLNVQAVDAMATFLSQLPIADKNKESRFEVPNAKSTFGWHWYPLCAFQISICINFNQIFIYTPVILDIRNRCFDGWFDLFDRHKFDSQVYVLCIKLHIFNYFVHFIPDFINN